MSAKHPKAPTLEFRCWYCPGIVQHLRNPAADPDNDLAWFTLRSGNWFLYGCPSCGSRVLSHCFPPHVDRVMLREVYEEVKRKYEHKVAE